MMKPTGIVRWDPKSRAGAVAIRRERSFDVQSVSDTTDLVMDWASYQNLAANVDNVETSKFRGKYDWRSYLREEADIAREREAARAKSRPKPQERAAPAPAPSSLYA